MPKYTATTIDLYGVESSHNVLNATTKQEAFLSADFIGKVLNSIKNNEGIHISFDQLTEIPVYEVEVLIEYEGKAIEIEVPSFTIDRVQTLIELLWGPDALLAVRFNNRVMNFDNKRIISRMPSSEK